MSLQPAETALPTTAPQAPATPEAAHPLNGAAPKPSLPLGNSRLPRPARRSKRTRVLLAVGAALAVAGLFAAASLAFFGGGRSEPYKGPVWTVKYEPLQVAIIERGALEAAKNTEIVARVKAGTRGSTTATTIKWVIDDGTEVKTGDKLVELDDSGLDKELKNQLILVEEAHSKALGAHAQYEVAKTKYGSAVKVANLDKDKYIYGDHVQALTEIQYRINIAKSDLELWRDRANWSERMVKKGYVSRSQAEGDRSRYTAALEALNKVEQEKKILETYTLDKMTEELKAKIKEADINKKELIAQAESEKKAKDSVYQKEMDRKREIEDEIRKCVIYAPIDGVVVYYVSEQSRFGSGSRQSIIAQGEPVSEGQKLMRIPNLKRMQVNTRVHEALVSRVKGDENEPTHFSERVKAAVALGPDLWASTGALIVYDDKVRDEALSTDDAVKAAYREREFRIKKDPNTERLLTGQKATIRVDAFPDRTLNGHVKSVATVASQSDWMSSDVKVYQTMVSIDEDLEQLGLKALLKPNMSAEVTIHVDASTEPVLAVPLQAVLGTVGMNAKRKVYVVDEDGRAREREITVKRSNEKMVEVVEGLREGDKVVMNPRSLADPKSKLRPAGGAAGRGGDEDGDPKAGKGKGGKGGGKGGKGGMKGGKGPMEQPGGGGPGGPLAPKAQSSLRPEALPPMQRRELELRAVPTLA